MLADNSASMASQINQWGESIVLFLGHMGLVWLIYLVASVGFLAVFWRLTRMQSWPWLSWMLRALMLAMVYTPWYANTSGNVLAPALMVAVLDAITIAPGAAWRALVPLLLSVVATLIVANVLYFRRQPLYYRHGADDEIHRY